jgi:cyclophilin family peptidyl-prolyl cis-trans isomerase
MNGHSSLSIAFLLCMLTTGASAQGIPEQATGALEAARVAAPGLVGKAEERAAEMAPRAAAAAGVTRPQQPGPVGPATANPAVWGAEDVRKLAIMDVKLGRETRTVTIELFPEDAPKTVANFIANVDSSLYNGLAFHRCIDGYLVQTGDPLTADNANRNRWGTGGTDRIPAEIKRKHAPGSVVMARRGDRVNPDRKSNDSQFYFALGNMSSLDGQYTVFGQVVSGLDVLDVISRLPADSNDAPLERIEIKSVKVVDHKGPLMVAGEESEDGRGGRRVTKPASAKGPLTRFLERIW